MRQENEGAQRQVQQTEDHANEINNWTDGLKRFNDMI